MRAPRAAAWTQIEQIISKNTTQTKNKVRNVAYSEDLVRSNIQTLYDTILEKKVEYDSATTAWQAAQNTWQAAQIQYGTGSLSQIAYMQQELAYLQARGRIQVSRSEPAAGNAELYLGRERSGCKCILKLFK